MRSFEELEFLRADVKVKEATVIKLQAIHADKQA
jgi:hypothetical protein